MDIIDTTGTNVTVPAMALEESLSTQISSDFEMFLKMLTAQMEYQDPLNPVESTDYATQLAAFSNVEQAVLTNDLLKDLTDQMTASGLADMAAWVGKEARTTAPAYFDGEPLTLLSDASPVADEVEIVVRNENGVEVQRLPVPLGAESVEWAGVATDGSPLPNGLYAFETVSMSGEELVAQSPAAVYSTITEVRLDDGQTMLVLGGGSLVSSTDVTALRDPTS